MADTETVKKDLLKLKFPVRTPDGIIDSILVAEEDVEQTELDQGDRTTVRVYESEVPPSAGREILREEVVDLGKAYRILRLENKLVEVSEDEGE